MKIVPSEKYVFFIFLHFTYMRIGSTYSASPNANIPGGYRTDTRINAAKKMGNSRREVVF
jgi:hypothetical protein